MRQARYYQVDCKSAVEKALLRKIRRQLVVMPGGTGKTFTAINTVRLMGRIGWVAASEELIDQAAYSLILELGIMPFQAVQEIFEQYDGSIIAILKDKHPSRNVTLIQEQVGVIKAEHFDIHKPFVVCSAQTLYRRLDRIPVDWFKVLVTDEADLFFSRTFREPLDTLQFDLLLGLTATPFRADGVPMDDIFEEIVYEYEIGQAIKDGFLCELDAKVIKTSTNLDKVGTRGGDFVDSELSSKVNTPERNNKIVSKYLEYAEGRQFMAHCCDVQHAIDLCETFVERGISCKVVVGDKNITPNRKEVVSEYRSGELMGICQVNVFSAGADFPNMGCVIMARPTKSKRLFLQQLFRVTRLKEQWFVDRFGQIGIILDIVDGTSRHKLINTHELDKELPIEERVFTSRADKDKLLAARQEKLMQEVKEEKKVELFPVPQVRVTFGDKAHQPISEGQKAWLRMHGYDTSNQYTVHQFHIIYFGQPAPEQDVAWLKGKGYDVSGVITNGQVTNIRNELSKQRKL